MEHKIVKIDRPQSFFHGCLGRVVEEIIGEKYAGEKQYLVEFTIGYRMITAWFEEEDVKHYPA